MSVTFTIENNAEYCRANRLVRTETETLGNNTLTFEIFPFEMNLSNYNAFAFLEALGIEAEEYGKIDAKELICKLAELASMPSLLFTENVSVDSGDGGPTVISCGRTTKQWERYQNTLIWIAAEALKRNERVVWS